MGNLPCWANFPKPTEVDRARSHLQAGASWRACSVGCAPATRSRPGARSSSGRRQAKSCARGRMFTLLKLGVALVALLAFAWFGMTQKLGSRTLFEHMHAIGQTKESQELVDGTRQAAGPLVDDVRHRIGGKDDRRASARRRWRATRARRRSGCRRPSSGSLGICWIRRRTSLGAPGDDVSFVDAPQGRRRRGRRCRCRRSRARRVRTARRRGARGAALEQRAPPQARDLAVGVRGSGGAGARGGRARARRGDRGQRRGGGIATAAGRRSAPVSSSTATATW